jgi:WD40 repeat protein/serine/threonine protein kinase
MFGKLMIKAGLVTEEQLRGCLHMQRELEKEGKPYRLGAIMVSQGLLTKERMEEILALQEKLLKRKERGISFEDAERLWAKVIGEGATPGVTIKGESANVRVPLPVDVSIRPGKVTMEGKSPKADKDFELVELLGQGGMGLVFAARQISIDRQIALKMIKPEHADNGDRQAKFISEAMVTGELEHPNIIPVHELGCTQEGKLFYCMKQVRGTSWNHMIKGKTEAENLEILLRVCDAVAFAHDKGIIHRDLKPENVMLGDYGEVMVMDWGLAVSVDKGGKAEPLTPQTSRAGTPGYMAPEMARCENHRIGKWSDIYLLGGILYEIVTGLWPHTADGALSCIHAAMKNAIQSTNKKGELVDIALKALATEPEDRYEGVKAFQQAIRDYQSHLESIHLTRSAQEQLAHAKKSRKYGDYAQVLYGFREALKLWPGNKAAQEGVNEASLAYAFRAYGKGDYELADSLLNISIPSHRNLAERVEQAMLARDARMQRLKALAFSSTPFAWGLVVILAIAFLWSFTKNSVWKYQAEFATQRSAALDKEVSKGLERIKELEEKLGIPHGEDSVASSIDDTQAMVPSSSEATEKSKRELTLEGHGDRVLSVAFSPNGKSVATTSKDETVKIWNVERGEHLRTFEGHSSAVNSVAFAPDGVRIVTGSSDRTAKIWHVENGEELNILKGHTDPVNSVAFFSDGSRVMTGSSDKTAKIWNAENGWELLTLKGHAGEVHAVAFSPDGLQVITGSGDKTAKIWDAEGGWEVLTLEGHTGAVRSVAFSPDGKSVVTASSDKTVKIWDRESGQELKTLKGHPGKIYSVAFSPDGTRLVTASSDETTRIWDVASGQELKTLKSHSGEVYAAVFSPDSKRLATASSDKTAKIWNTLEKR